MTAGSKLALRSEYEKVAALNAKGLGITRALRHISIAHYDPTTCVDYTEERLLMDLIPGTSLQQHMRHVAGMQGLTWEHMAVGVQ